MLAMLEYALTAMNLPLEVFVTAATLNFDVSATVRVFDIVAAVVLLLELVSNTFQVFVAESY